MKYLLSILLIVGLVSSGVFAVAAGGGVVGAPPDGSVWFSKPYTMVLGVKEDVNNDAMLINTRYAVDVYAKMPEKFDHFALDISNLGLVFKASNAGYFVPASAGITDIEKVNLGSFMVGGIISPIAAPQSTSFKLGTLSLSSNSARVFNIVYSVSIQGALGAEMVKTTNSPLVYGFIAPSVVESVPGNECIDDDALLQLIDEWGAGTINDDVLLGAIDSWSISGGVC